MAAAVEEAALVLEVRTNGALATVKVVDWDKGQWWLRWRRKRAKTV